MSQSTILITGASRGIGASLAAKYLLRPNTTVVATVRQVTTQHEERLHSLPCGQGSRVIILPFDMNVPSSITEGVALLQTEYGIKSLDLVIANAGICDAHGPVAKISEAGMLEHFEVNTVGLLRLFKATIPLLSDSEKPKLVYISTSVASISQLNTWSVTTEYGISKMAGNFLMKMISIEHSNVIALSISPGFVQTDMGNRGAKALGLEKAPLTVEDCTAGVIKLIDAASKEITGRFLDLEGGEIPW
ncbi:NAD(P)-binding protein [Trichoderma velutinum]